MFTKWKYIKLNTCEQVYSFYVLDFVKSLLRKLPRTPSFHLLKRHFNTIKWERHNLNTGHSVLLKKGSGKFTIAYFTCMIVKTNLGEKSKLCFTILLTHWFCLFRDSGTEFYIQTILKFYHSY